MGADPIRPRAARHAVMAAYYQIAGAAERSVSPSLVGKPRWQRWRQARTQAHSGNANSTKCEPCGRPARPSSSLGSAFAIFSVPGPTSPRPPWRPLAGLFLSFGPLPNRRALARWERADLNTV